jgi:hypothetical protein
MIKGYCENCLKIDDCPYEGNDISWIERRGGCPFKWKAEVEEKKGFMTRRRVGQQKQKFSDRSYSSKNERKGKYRRTDT